METIAQLVTVSVAILIVSGYLAYGAKRHIACVAIMQVLLPEIRSLALTDLWKTSRSTINFGINPRLSVILNCETSDASIICAINLKHTYCEFYEIREIDDTTYSFSVSCPAQYFDLKFLSRAIRQHERWAHSEPSNSENFYFPPTGQIMSTDIEGNMSVPSDPCYAEIRRMAKRTPSARYPILEY